MNQDTVYRNNRKAGDQLEKLDQIDSNSFDNYVQIQSDTDQQQQVPKVTEKLRQSQVSSQNQSGIQ